MNYAKTAALKPNNKKETLQQKTEPRSEEQQKLLDFIGNLRKSGPRHSQSNENSNKKCPQQSRHKFPKLFGGLSKKLKELKISETEETPEEKKERLQHVIDRFDTPFNWRPIYKKFTNQKESVLLRLQDKDDEIVDENRFKWRNFILRLVISYELFLVGKVSEALDTVKGLQETLIINTDNVEWMFLGVKDALWHVVNASLAFLYLETNDLKEAEWMIERVQKVTTMRRAGRAGIHGIRAAVFMEFGHEGNMKALPEAKKASELDTKLAEWHFLVGKCMGRIRRVAHCHDPVNFLEVKSFNKAAKIDAKNPLYTVYLAQVIRERTFRIYKQEYPENRSEKRVKVERAYKAALYKYQDARNMRPNCPHILIRCAYGVMKLPFQYVNLEFVRECLDKAIELAPRNAMAHHIKGLFLERFNTVAEDAITELETAASLGSFGAAMNLVQMRFRLKKGDPVQELVDAANTFSEPSCVQVALTQVGSYLLFIKFDLVKAIKYFTKVVEMDINSYAMKSHKSLFLRMKDPVNLFPVLLLELDNNTEFTSFSQEDRMVIKKFRIKIMIHDTLENKVNGLTVAEIVDMSKRNVTSDQTNREKYKNKIKRAIKRKWRSKKKSKKKLCKENEVEVKYSMTKLQEFGGDSNNLTFGEELCSLKAEQRSKSVTSVSSVESDYQRDSLLHGPRGFFLNSDLSNSKEADSVILQTDESNVSNSTVKFSDHFNRFQNFHSRRSSVSSVSSDDELGARMPDFQSQQYCHSSRYVSQMSISNKEPEDGLSKISSSFSNLSVYEPSSSDFFRTRRTSVSSIESDTGTEKLSVMDRVKQSYAMLNRTSTVNDQSEKKCLKRSESVQSINKKQKKKGTIQRTDSTQSLDAEVDALRSRLERYKPFGSSGSSNTFLPSFAQKR